MKLSANVFVTELQHAVHIHGSLICKYIMHVFIFCCKSYVIYFWHEECTVIWQVLMVM